MIAPYKPSGTFTGIDVLARKPDATVMVVNDVMREDVAAMFPDMAVIGISGSPKPDLLANRSVIVWPACDAEREALPQSLCGVATKVGIIAGELNPLQLDNATAARHYARANLTRYAPRADAPAAMPAPQPSAAPGAPPAQPVDVSAAVEAAKADPSALLEPAVLDQLRQIRFGNPAEYQRIRAQAKAAKVPIGELDRLTKGAAAVASLAEARERRKAQAEPADGPAAKFSHDALAKAFTAARPDWRYVAAWGKWFAWNGTYWREDTLQAVAHDARQVCREQAEIAHLDGLTPGTVRSIASAAAVTAVERLAGADPAHARPADLWDADPWLLNTPGGVVDLRTGTIRPGRPEDHLTKITRATPVADSQCPQWCQFLIDATRGNGELITYLQRMAGYLLTGSVEEHALFFFHGQGGNGKGTFLETLAWVLHDYAGTASTDLLTESHQPQHLTFQASLMGKRLVIAQEVGEGKRWHEAKLTSLTGGDRITANYMRHDPFTFDPTHKFAIGANNKPIFRNVNDAIRRRLNLIPFTFKPTTPDSKLRIKLQAEADGILRWMVAGCMEWQRMGLQPPEIVRAETTKYLNSQDTIEMWKRECCDTDPTIADLRTPFKTIFDSYKAWCALNTEQELGRKRFTEAMESHGHECVSERKHTFFRGIRLAEKPATESDRLPFG